MTVTQSRKPLALMALLLMTLSPVALFAQVPPRPGLILLDEQGNQVQPQQGGTRATTPPNQMPTTNLVQRDFQGQGPGPGQSRAGQTGAQGGVPGGQPGLQNGQGNLGGGQQSARPNEFFFIEDGAPGPADLAGGLSDFNSNTMSQTGSQLRGEFGAIHRNGLPQGMVQDAWNRPFDNMSQGQSAPGNVRFQWSPDTVMPVRLRSGMITNVILPDWETAEDVLIGDGAAVEARIIRGNVVAVRSLSVGVDASLSVMGGSGNLYTFYLRTEGRNTRVLTDLQVFVQAAPSTGSGEWFRDERILSQNPEGHTPHRVGGPQSPDITRSRSVSQGDEPVPVDRRIFDMRMYEVSQGDRIIAPEYVYTDGRFTYLHFPAGMTDRPVIRRIVDGVEGRVNTRVTGRHSQIVIVEAMGDFILRSGTRAVCLVQVDNRGAVRNR